ncbi:dihydrolipoamide acetyltransferase family protein [Arsenicicoccus sp. UBA7492]|uniref:dihydrolipoamide acetyltransferase family protein n=1 Tax=Arsenicicoccus sp. UBA7492 TaxID=1946057 RepID=UPI002580FB4D|nr:dihydrolipoamide acetyltransferase family protein [Arsenicicoccus sp. UBA7492]
MSHKVFHLPDLGEGLTEAEVVSWLVGPGDTVVVDQPIAVVETAKAQVELPCPYAGSVVTLHGEAGHVVDVGAPFITVDVDVPADGITGGGASEASDVAVDTYREEERAGSGAVLIGYGTSEGSRRRRRRVGAGGPTAPAAGSSLPSAAPVMGDTAGPVVDEHVPPEVSSKPGAAVRVISPLVRQLADEHGIDLRTVTPTAPGGIIRRCDVMAVVTARGEGGAPGSLAPQSESRVTSTAGSPTPDRRIPLTGIRGTIASRLATSRREIPDATTWVDVDATDFLAVRRQLPDARPEARIGVLALLGRVMVAGLRRYPELNSTVDTAANEVVVRGAINLGFAAQSPRGLVVPVVHGAGEMTLAELSTALRELTTKAMDGTLSPAEMTGGTFTLNNYGGYGVDGSTPIINHPEAAMVGVGRMIDKPWVVDGALAVRKVGTIGLTFDHRVCDGGTAGGFIRYVADCIERPTTLLLDL